MKPTIQISLRTLLLLVTLLAIAFGVYSAIRSRPSNQPAAAAPLAVGILDHVTVWKKPVQRPGETGSNEGNSPPPGSSVEVYEHFILITPPTGPTILSPHGWYTDLTFKRNAAPSAH